MLVVQIKPEEEIFTKISSKRLFILECLGCQEVYFPTGEIEKFIDNLKEEIVGKASLDYLCNREFVKEYIDGYSKQIKKAQIILVFSCGVGVQVVSSLLEDKIVYTCCDTLYLNGFQGLTVQEYNCDQCGECHLNYTCGICPIAQCPKHMLNGPCGGSQGGKCEVDPDVPCAWQQIVDRLAKLRRLDKLEELVTPQNWSVDLISEPPVRSFP